MPRYLLELSRYLQVDFNQFLGPLQSENHRRRIKIAHTLHSYTDNSNQQPMYGLLLDRNFLFSNPHVRCRLEAKNGFDTAARRLESMSGVCSGSRAKRWAPCLLHFSVVFGGIFDLFSPRTRKNHENAVDSEHSPSKNCA
jgi:hypothetical protein